MAQTRQRTAEEYAQIAFVLPSEFIKIFTSLTPKQCREIISVTDVRGRNVINVFENDYPNRNVLIFILNNLDQEQIDQICLIRDAENRTLLHRLANSYNNDNILDMLYKKISSTALSEILLFPDIDKRTILHYQTSLCSIEIFKEVLKNSKIVESLNSACLLQDWEGKTILHHSAASSRHGYNYYEALLNTISDEAFCNAVGLLDSKNNNMLYYLLDFGNGSLITHQKGKSAQAALLSSSYSDALIALLTSLHYNGEDKFTMLFSIGDHIKSLQSALIKIKIIKEAILEMGLGQKLFLKTKPLSLPLIIVILNTLARLKQICDAINDDIQPPAQIPPEAAALDQEIRNLLSAIDEKVNITLFKEAFIYFKKSSFKDKTIFIENIQNFLQDMDFIPYLDKDPLTVFEMTKIEVNISLLEKKLTQLNFNDTKDLFQYQNYLLNPAQAVLDHPKEAAEYYNKIMLYQYNLGPKFNTGYLKIFNEAAASLEMRDTSKYPNTDQIYTICLKQMKSMIAQADSCIRELNLDVALNLKFNEIMTSKQCIQSSDYCFISANQLPADDLDKIKLEYKGLRFLYLAITQMINDSKPVLTPITTPAPAESEEKKDDIEQDEEKLSLDESEHTETVDSNENGVLEYNIEIQKNISLFNSRIYHCQHLGVDHIDLSADDDINEDNYRSVMLHHFSEIEERNKTSWTLNSENLANYMLSRAADKPSFLANSQEDFNIRKGYYDAISCSDNRPDAIYKKLDIINSALADPRLAKGRTQRFLNLVNNLKNNYETFIFLHEASTDTTLHTSTWNMDLTFLTTLTTEACANILLNAPICFKHIYTLIKPEVYNEIITKTDIKSISLFEHYEKDVSNDLILHILKAVTLDNFEKIILASDNNNKTLLHKLSPSANSDELQSIIFATIKAETLAKILIMQDNKKQTILHCNPAFIKKIITYPTASIPNVLEKLNAACILQDNTGKTVLHYLAESPSLIAVLINLLYNITDETMDKILLLHDKQNRNILEILLLIAMANPIVLASNWTTKDIEFILSTITDKQYRLKSNHSAQALFHVIKNRELLLNESDSIHMLTLKLSMIASFLTDVLRQRNTHEQLFKSISRLSHIPAIFYFLIVLSDAQQKKIFTDSMLQDILNNLFVVIPIDTFVKNFKQSPSTIRYKIILLLQSANFVPYVFEDPLKIAHAFHYNDDGLYPDDYVKFRWKACFSNTVRQFSEYFLLPNLQESTGTFNNFEALIEFYSHVTSHQLTLKTKLNSEYINHLKVLINNIENMLFPVRDAHQIKKLKLMLQQLKYAHKPDAKIILSIDKDTNMNLNQLQFWSSMSINEFAALNDNDNLKSILQLNYLHFEYLAAKNKIQNLPVSSISNLGASDSASDSDDELEDNELLDDEKKYEPEEHAVIEPSVDLDAYPSPRLLNSEINTFLNLWPRYAYMNTGFQLLNLCCAVIKQQQQAAWNTQMEEFDEYIKYRKEIKPTLFANSQDDLAVREAYYHLVKVEHKTPVDIANKIETIDKALHDPKLMKGWMNTHRCLDILKKLRETLRYIQYLNDYENKYKPEIVNQPNRSIGLN